MLILTRKSGEGIRIGDNIIIKIIEIRGNQIRLGVDAPRSTAVHREEIYELIQKQNQASALSSPADPQVLMSVWDKQKKKSNPSEEPHSGTEKDPKT